MLSSMQSINVSFVVRAHEEKGNGRSIFTWGGGGQAKSRVVCCCDTISTAADVVGKLFRLRLVLRYLLLMVLKRSLES